MAGSRPLLPPSVLGALSARGDVREVVADTWLITEGDLDDRVFVLLSGRMKVFTRGSCGREFVYNVIRAGEIFGELGLDGDGRSASVAALEHCRYVEIARNEIGAFMQAHPEFAELLVMVLIGRVRHITRQTQQLAFDTVYGRMVEAFREDTVVEGGRHVLATLRTQKDIAARVGATREMVGHILRDLEIGGYVVRGKDKRLLIAKPLPKGW